jgi:hypothetical protein
MTDYLLALLIFIPITIFSVLRKVNFLYALFFVIYFQGVFSILDIPMGGIKAVIEMLVWLFFLIALFEKGSSARHIPGTTLFLAFTLFYLVASILNRTLNFDSFSYFRHHLNAFLLMAAVYMFPFQPTKLFRINRFVFFLFVIQILASAIKLALVGRSEEHVGTMVITTGTMHTIFPIMAIIFMAYAWIWLGRKRKYLLYILGFMFMGWVGDKRGIYFYIVVILGVLFWRWFRTEKRGHFIPVRFLRWAPLFPLIMVMIFYLGLRLTPTLNPEKKVWGSYDPEFLASYFYYYNIKDSKNEDYRGRFGGTYILLSEFFKGNGLMIRREIDTRSVLTGFGADKHVGVVSERISKLEAAGIYRPPGVISTGFTQSLLATGVIGVILLVWFFLFYSRKVSKISHNPELNPYWRVILNSTSMLGLLFLLDYFTYSPTFYTNNTIYLTFFYFVGQSLKPDLMTKYNTVPYPSKLI